MFSLLHHPKRHGTFFSFHGETSVFQCTWCNFGKYPCGVTAKESKNIHHRRALSGHQICYIRGVLFRDVREIPLGIMELCTIAKCAHNNKYLSLNIYDGIDQKWTSFSMKRQNISQRPIVSHHIMMRRIMWSMSHDNVSFWIRNQILNTLICHFALTLSACFLSFT